MTLPDSVRSLILGRAAQKETLNVDFKWSFSIQSKSARKEFAKDVVALANTIATQGDEKAYLVLGIRDPRDRDRSPEKMEPPFHLLGDMDRIRDFNRDLQNIVNHHCRPVPNICYEECDALEEDIGAVAWISIAKALAYPVETTNMGESHEDGIALIRSGPGDPGRRRLSSEECEALRYAQFGENPISSILGANLVAKFDQFEYTLKSQNLFALLTDDDAKSRADALQRVGDSERKSQITARHQAQVVAGMLHDDDNRVIWQAIQTLRRISHPVAVTSLLHLCRNRIEQKDDILIEAVGAIGEIAEDGSVVPALEELGQAFNTPDSPLQLDEEFAEVIGSAVENISIRLRPQE